MRYAKIYRVFYLAALSSLLLMTMNGCGIISPGALEQLNAKQAKNRISTRNLKVFIGKYFAIRPPRYVFGTQQSPEDFWNYLMAMTAPPEKSGVTKSVNTPDPRRWYQRANLKQLNSEVNPITGSEVPLMLHVLDCDKIDSRVPLFKVQVLNKQYAGTIWWISAKDLRPPSAKEVDSYGNVITHH